MGRKRKDEDAGENEKGNEKEKENLPAEPSLADDRDIIDEAYERLITMRSNLLAAKDLWKQGIDKNSRDAILADLRNVEERIHQTFEDCKPSELQMYQGKLAGIRLCAAKIGGEAWADDIAEVEKQMTEFEEANALFIRKAGPVEFAPEPGPSGEGEPEGDEEVAL